MKKTMITILALSFMIFSVACSNQKDDTQNLPSEVTGEPTVTVAPTATVAPTVTESIINTPTGDAIDSALDIVAGADEAKKIDISTIKTIQVYDLEGNLVKEISEKEEIAAVGTAYNESMIDDISYIEMITGYTMDIALANDQIIHITSYGDETRVVATVNEMTYHLICPEIAKILLSDN
jgi:hypothetical protein